MPIHRAPLPTSPTNPSSESTPIVPSSTTEPKKRVRKSKPNIEQPATKSGYVAPVHYGDPFTAWGESSWMLRY